MRKKTITICVFMFACLIACKKNNQDTIDTAYPVIDVSAANSFPKQCSAIKRGETFIFRALVSDNAELGSVSIDIHHNFDHHTHSTEVESCTMEAIKTPVKPFLLIQSNPIPQGNKSYEIQSEVNIPADVDAGDYHFLIRLTDKEGWQTLKGLSIKIN